jgi:hypothetical protein
MLTFYLHYRQIIQTNEVQKKWPYLQTALTPRASGFRSLTPVKHLRVVKKKGEEEEEKGRAFKRNCRIKQKRRRRGKCIASLQ